MSLNTNKQPLVVIVGPTASGKSNLGIQLARKFNGEIISADSRQVYRGMDIGTGKVLKDKNSKSEARNSKQIRNSNLKVKNKYYSGGIRHHLIDIASPKKQFTVSDFKKLGEKALSDIAKRSKLPIIVGGTGFYIDILLGRMAVAEIPPNKKLRAKLEKLSIEKLYAKLEKLDPQRSKTIDRYNKRRLVRALEVSYGLKANSLQPIAYGLRPITYNALWLGINPGKEKLAKNIKNRLEKRFEQGMIKEVKNLIKNGVSHRRLERFGLEYKWLSLYLQNKISYQEMKENLCRDIIHYSKRQMTWFKSNKEIHWLNPPTGGLKKAKRVVSTFLQKTAR